MTLLHFSKPLDHKTRIGGNRRIRFGPALEQKYKYKKNNLPRL